MPAPSTIFVGRQRDVSTLVDQLKGSQARLLTVTGPGGVGKTRLAITVASEVAGRFADGVRFVSLAPLADHRLVASVILHALGIREARDQTLSEVLKHWPGSGNTLKVLDNFEHLIAAAPVVAELLDTCPQLRILCTSRTRLNLAGERVYPLSALEPGAAVELFEQRAGARPHLHGFCRESPGRTGDLRVSGWAAPGDRAGGGAHDRS